MLAQQLTLQHLRIIIQDWITTLKKISLSDLLVIERNTIFNTSNINLLKYKITRLLMQF